MKKMNSFGPSSPPTLASAQAPSGDSAATVAAGSAKSKSSAKQLGKQLSKSSSIGQRDGDPKEQQQQQQQQQQPAQEETPEEKFKKFEGEGVTFKAKLVGSELVMEPRGDKMCQNSIQRLKAIIKGQKVHKQRIVLKISYAGVKVYDEKSNEILHHHGVPQISFIASDDTDSRTFGYVCDVPNKAHQFICFKTNGPALQVMTVISSLFEAVLEKKKQADGSASGPTATPTSADQPDKRVAGGGAASSEIERSPFDDENDVFGKDAPSATTGAASAMLASDLISGSVGPGDGASSGQPEKNSKLEHNEKGGAAAGLEADSPAITSTGSKKDIRSYFDDLKDLQITKIDHTPPFHLIHGGASGGGGGGGGGDSGIMDSSAFSDWSALSSSMVRTSSAAQMSRTDSGAGLNRTNSAAGGLLFESNYSAGPPASAAAAMAQPPSSLYFNAAHRSSASTTPMSPMSPFGASPPDHFGGDNHRLAQQQHHQPPPTASQAMFIPPRTQGGSGAGLVGSPFGQQATQAMMVPNYQQQQQQQQQHPHQQHQSGATSPNAASFGAFFEPPHSNMIVGSAPMNQMSHHQMSQHARFSSSMVAGLHQRLGSSAASIQSTNSAGGLSRQTNPFDDEFFA